MILVENIVADNIKNIRQFREMSQAELAEAIDVSTGYIGVIETGKKFPSLEVMEKIAEVLSVPLYRLFQSDEDIIEAHSPDSLYMIKQNVEKNVQIALNSTFAHLKNKK